MYLFPIIDTAIEEENFDGAWSLHQGLIVDFTSICSPWMVGVKTLIIESRNLRKKEATEEETVKTEMTEEDSSQVPMVSPVDMSQVTISEKEEEPKSEPPSEEVE